MATRTLRFNTTLLPDAPLRQDARYSFGAEDRQSIDVQVLGVQTFLSRTHLNGVSATYVTFVGDNGAAGDIVCSANGLNGKPTVMLATDAALLDAGGPMGILLEDATQGSKALIAWGGIVGPEVTALAAGSPGWVRVVDYRCEYTAALTGNDYVVGWVDDGGFLTLGRTPLADVSAGVLTLAATAPIKVDVATGHITVSWLATGNVSMSGYGWTSCTGVTNAGGAVAITAGGGAASLAGSTTATVSANGGALLLEGATNATLNATTGALAMTGGTTAAVSATAAGLTLTGATTAALTATAGALTCTGGTTASLTASGGAAAVTGSTNATLTATAGDVVLTAGDDITLAAAGTTEITGADVRMTGVADGVAGYLAIGTTGIVTRGTGGTGASTTAYYVTNASAAVNANDVPLQNLASPLVFTSSTDPPVWHRRIVAPGIAPSEVLPLDLYCTGPGAIGMGPRIIARAYDANEDPVEFGAIDFVGTDVTAGTHATKLVFSAVTGGALTEIGSWTGEGALTVTGDVTVGGDLIVQGTTVTVDSTTVSLADRLVVFNSSTGIVVAPVAIAGFAIDRGSVDGVTKRDAPGVLWDEANSRFAVAYNTTLDQSTIGTYVTVKVGGLISPSLDNPSGAVTIGASATSAAVTPDTTFSGTVTELRPGITTTVTPGFIASNATTAATPSPLVQYGPAFISSGGAWETGGGGSAKTIRGGFYTRGISSGTAGAEVVFVYDTGGGTFSEGGRVTTNLPGVGGVGFVAPTIVCDGGNGLRLVSSGTDRGNVKWSGSAIEVNAGSNPITLASSSGTTIDTQASTLRVLAPPGTPASAGAALTIDLSRQNAEHTITQNTTVSFSNPSVGESGIVIFIQDGTGRTITMPAASGSIEYIDSIEALTVTGIVDTTAATKTILKYYVMTGPKILFYYRATSAT